MAVTVNQTVTAASVSTLKPRVSVAVVHPVTEVEYVIPVAAIASIQFQASATLDPEGRNPYQLDPVAVLDTRVIEFAKAATESISVADAVQFLSVDKGLTDTVGMIDVMTRLLIFIREFADQFGVSDVTAIETAIAVVDSLMVADAQTKVLSKAIPDGVAMNDQADTADGFVFSFSRAVNNVVFPADSAAIAFARVLQDQASLVDLFSAQLSKQLAEQSFAADFSTLTVGKGLLDSQTTLDAIQSFSTTKGLANSTLASDSHSISTSPSLQDQIGQSDAATKLVSKETNESVATSESASLSSSKAMSDSFGMSDLGASVSSTKSVQDLFGLSDLISANASKNLQDSIALVDAINAYRSIGQPASDSASTQDQLSSVSLQRLFTDGVAMNDQAETADGFIFSFSTSFSNVSFVNDSRTVNASKGLGESVTTSSSGSLISQGYCDLSYFAGDYVGDSRTFI